MTEDEHNNNTRQFKQDSVCRLCAHASNHLIDIFKHDNKRESGLVSKYIQRYFDVDIKQDDPHSRCICGACWCLLDLVIKKRNKFKENDSKLRDTPAEKKLALPQIKEHPGLVVSDSVKQIFAENSCIKLPAKYWRMNFDVQVDLSTCKLSVDLANTPAQMFSNETKNIDSTIEPTMKRKQASNSKGGSLKKKKS